MSTPNGEKLFHFVICGDKFSWISVLKSHVPTLTGEKHVIVKSVELYFPRILFLKDKCQHSLQRNYFIIKSIRELIFFIYCGLFVLILVVFVLFSSFTTFWPNFTSGLLQVILPRPWIGMLSLVTVSPVITAFHSCCLSHCVFDQVNLWPVWVGFETAIF